MRREPLILFESDQILLVDKPAGMLTIPGRVVNPPRADLHAWLSKKLSLRLLTVHRLDSEVSGLVAFAKTAVAHRELSMAFERGQVKKTYEAWTEGSLQAGEREFLWESRLLRGKKRAYKSTLGKLSRTRATCQCEPIIWGGRSYLHWSVEPLTGRSHQIRVHLADAGFPILGDAKYGSILPFREGEIALRAVRLEFTHGPVFSAEALG